MMPSKDESVTLIDSESGHVLFEDVACDAVDELSSPGPKDDLVADWLKDATQVASDTQLRAYIRSAGTEVPRNVDDMREKAFWIACCEHAEQGGDENDDDVNYGDPNDGEDDDA